jgi:Ras-related protein Rab-11A
MGLDSIHKTVQLSEGSLINCQIYDTAGQEKYKALNTTYYKRADAVLLVYDITKKKVLKMSEIFIFLQ